MSITINSGIRDAYQYKTINTNSKQYQAAAQDSLSAIMMEEMTMTPEERYMYELFGGRERLMKNKMQMYDSDGNRLNAHGVAGMDATGKSLAERHQIINVSEDARQSMFDEVKRHFMLENGVANGDTTRRTDIFTAYQKSVPIEDRQKGTWTLEQYERNYRQAFYDACKAADPKWELGKSIPAGALDNVTRESVDSMLVKSNGQYGETLVRKSVDITV